MTQPNHYTTFIKEIARISAQVPLARPPPLLNSHLRVTAPFVAPSGDFEVQRRSEAYHGSARAAAAAGGGGGGLSDAPVPLALRRRVFCAAASTLGAVPPTALGKVAGFRIEVNGKRGTRAAKQTVHYGKLRANDSHNSMVDFGRASFFNKKGATGVKVWIAYEQ
ncbi:hypothetical protein BDR26DRAFT_934455 [Obelidium mucronatum]|nr:hypothetical protein BDR26DRAFT_934455 [Obelidium mucronatum]